MADIRRGTLSRNIVGGKVIHTGAWAEGVHTMDEMRAFVAEHLVPVERPEGSRYEQRFNINADSTTTFTETAIPNTNWRGTRGLDTARSTDAERTNG